MEHPVLVSETIHRYKDGNTENNIIVYLSPKYPITSFVVVDETGKKHSFTEQELRKN